MYANEILMFSHLFILCNLLHEHMFVFYYIYD